MSRGIEPTSLKQHGDSHYCTGGSLRHIGSALYSYPTVSPKQKGTSTHATRGSLRHVSETKRGLTFIARNGAGDTSALHCARSVLCLRSKTGSHTGMRGAPRQLARHADQGCSPQNVLTSNKPTDRKVWMAYVNDGGCNGSISVGCLVDTLLG